jgi:lysophospholipase L1-like esterase
LFGAGFAFLVAILINEVLILFISGPAKDGAVISHIRGVQLIFLIAAALFIAFAYCAGRISWLESFSRKEAVANTLLALLPILTVFFIVEFSLRPFVEARQLTTIFMRDDRLEWKLKPNAEDVWGGVRVKINSKGLIGPEVDYAKPPDVKRILYLGDSVAFGFRLDSYRLSFPFLTENILERDLGCEIETVNTAVGGYSPGQEYLLFSTEGIKYEPDLVVVCFVLNDVLAEFGLARFGKRGEGYQLAHTASGALEKLLSRSSIYWLARRIGARIRFGSDIQKGAQQQEELDVADVIYYPGRPYVREGWDMTFENLGRIFEYARERDIPVILAVFPFYIQFYDVANRLGPQKTVCAFARTEGVPAIDLLPLLLERMEETGGRPKDYFFDAVHLSPAGNKAVAEFLAGFIQSEELLVCGIGD